jgi:uncharacterized protein (TIGR02217 family)
MADQIYPTLPGIQYESTRTPMFNTQVQQALSGKESRIAYQQYPLMQFELAYEFLRNGASYAELQTLVGLYMQMMGKFGTFLYDDPVFNSVTAQQFAIVGSSDTTATTYQITATYQASGGPGTPELIQNFNGTPQIYVNGALQTLGTQYVFSSAVAGGINFLGGHFPTAAAVLTWTGSFYYRCRFDDDAMTATQFMQNLWSTGSIKFRQVKL